MKDIIIYGSGGMAKETAALIEDINEIEPKWRIMGFIDDIKGENGEVINGYKILGAHEILKTMSNSVYLVLAVGDPALKRKLYEVVKNYDVQFATLIHPAAKIAKTADIGEGTIITAGCIVSVNVTIGKHVTLNMRTVVGHDAVIRDFSSCLVNVIVSGNAVVNESVLLGSGSIVMEKKKVGAGSKVSMGSLVMDDVDAGAVVMTRPSKSMRFNRTGFDDIEGIK